MSESQTKVVVQLVRSPIASKPSHRACVKSLGLRRLNSISTLPKTPQVMGIIQEIRHLVKVLES